MVDAWLAGLIGGSIGTAAMTMLMMPMMKGQPSGPAMLLGRIFRKDPNDKVLMMPAMLTHLGVFLLMVMMGVWGSDHSDETAP